MGRQHDDNFRAIIEIAIEHGKAVRIGVNWGSLDQTLVTRLMDENAQSAAPKGANEVVMDAMVISAIESAEMARIVRNERKIESSSARRFPACRI